MFTVSKTVKVLYDFSSMSTPTSLLSFCSSFPPAITAAMFAGVNGWSAVAFFSETVMFWKETAEQDLQRLENVENNMSR